MDSDAVFEALVKEQCEEVLGLLHIANPTQASLVGLETIRSVGALRVDGPNMLTSLKGLDGLTTVVGTIYIDANNMLTSLEGLESLTSVGRLWIGGNTSLVSLRGLDGVTRLSNTMGAVDLADNPALETLGGLLDWPETTCQGSILIDRNAMLPQCEVATFDLAQTNPACACPTSGERRCTGNDGLNNCRVGTPERSRESQ